MSTDADKKEEGRLCCKSCGSEWRVQDSGHCYFCDSFFGFEIGIEENPPGIADPLMILFPQFVKVLACIAGELIEVIETASKKS